MVKKGVTVGVLIILAVLLVFYVRASYRYQKSSIMEVPVEEVSLQDYPEDPSRRSVYYGSYANRKLHLTQVNKTTFDFTFTSEDPKVATVRLQDIDLSLFVPVAPVWTREDKNLEIVSLVEREWNRQQVSFDRFSSHLDVVDGNGFEKENLVTVELARNCLNAGLWELLLFTEESGKKALHYQGWFTFPLGHYKEIFEAMNGKSYWNHWYRLEHWWDPAGKEVDLTKLRSVAEEKQVSARRVHDEKRIAVGEQQRKQKTSEIKKIACQGGVCGKERTFYASFIPPGRYSLDHPWEHEYEKIGNVEQVVLRTVRCPNGAENLHEVELLFKSSRNGELNRFIVGGIDLEKLPLLPVERYPEGLYMPLGIGISPFYQSYEALKNTVPYKSSYYSLLLDEKNGWINHHEVAIDGPVLHRDENDPDLLHLYLLSYERHNLVAHFIIQI